MENDMKAIGVKTLLIFWEFVDSIPVKECQVENVIDIKSESYSDSTGHENDREKVTGEKFDYGYRFRLRRVTKSHHWSR